MRPLTKRLALAFTVALLAATVSYVQRHLPETTRKSDFYQVWAAAHALSAGLHPYSDVGPGREYAWAQPQLYPMPAVLFALPFSAMSFKWADVAFVALGFGWLAFGLTRRTTATPTLCALVSASGVMALMLVQWSPLMMAIALTPAMGALWVLKPTIGLALLAAYPSRRAFVAGAALLGVSVAIWPWWPGAWLAATGYAEHITAPILRPSGFLLLALVPYWRSPDARVLIALACVPHTPMLYEALPLFLIVRRLEEGAALAVLSWAVAALQPPLLQGPTYLDTMQTTGTLIWWCLYLPAAGIVIARDPERVLSQFRRVGLKASFQK